MWILDDCGFLDFGDDSGGKGLFGISVVLLSSGQFAFRVLGV